MKKRTYRTLMTCVLSLGLMSSGCKDTTYTITVSGGTGGGTYKTGEIVTLNATIPEYKDFDYWSCNDQKVSTSNPYSFRASKDATYKAMFKSQTAAVTVINGTGSGVYDKGSSVTVTATLESGQTFNHWEIDKESVSTSNPYTFTVTKDTTIEAIINDNKATITVVNGTGGGRYNIGDEVTITANEAPQYQVFDHWECDGQSVSTDNPYTFTASKSGTYTAKYVSEKATITVVNGTGGGTYDKGSSVTITANSPSSGQVFDYWECEGQSVSTSSTFTFTATKDATYTAKYKESFRGVLRTDTTAIKLTEIDVSKGGTITIDYKYVDKVTDKDKTITLYVGSDDSSRFGGFTLHLDKLGSTHNGVTFTTLDDGYNRIILCVGQLSDVSGIKPTTINKIMFSSFDVTKGVYFDVTSEPINDEATTRGVFNKSGSYNSIPITDSYTVSNGGTLVVDYKYVDPEKDKDNGISIFFGSDDTNRFGNYKLFYNKLEKTYDGISVTALDDGYYRLTVVISKLNIWREQAGEKKPTVISEISFKWFECKEGAYFDVNPKPKKKKTTEFTMDDSEFVIANFADIHVTEQSLLSDTGTTGKTIKYGINKSNPDIMVFSGDIAGKASDLSYITSYLDSFKIPYFFILGNHDHDYLKYDTIASYLDKSEYGYIEKGPEDLGSQGNYTIKIKNNSGTLVHSLIMMDTGNKYTLEDDKNVEYLGDTYTKINGVKYGYYNSKSTYCDGAPSGKVWDGIRGNQITWFENTATSLKCDTTLFCHAGFNEYVKAFEKYQDAVNKKDQEKIAECAPIGEKNVMNEQVCGTVEKTGLFEKIKSCGTKNVICGHDHCNAYSLLYEGVRLTYSVKTGEGSYWQKDGSICGYTTLTIDNTGASTIDQIFYNPLLSL